ncbi:MAG: D-alanine--D-alanine ligase [Myxococcota bacterium]|nr:D-alanine--D-alanine ligase [Myxococcota bacterium]
MKRERIMVLMHEDLVPPDHVEGPRPTNEPEWQTEYDVVSTLRSNGHEVLKLGINEEIAPIRRAIQSWKPTLAFNLLEEFRGSCLYDQHVVSYLELLRMPYSGCNPRGLTIARDKALSKKILNYHRVAVPKFFVVPMGRKIRLPKHLDFPLIVKSLVADASLGIAQASVVDSFDKLQERVEFIHTRLETDAIVEEYIDGRELYVGVMGNSRLTLLPTWELNLQNLPSGANRIATEKVKWDPGYRKKHKIVWQKAELDGDVDNRIKKLSGRIYRRLGLSGYARLDFRLSATGHPYLIEANPNPDISRNGEFAESAAVHGVNYSELLNRLVRKSVKRRVV